MHPFPWKVGLVGAAATLAVVLLTHQHHPPPPPSNPAPAEVAPIDDATERCLAGMIPDSYGRYLLLQHARRGRP